MSAVIHRLAGYAVKRTINSATAPTVIYLAIPLTRLRRARIPNGRFAHSRPRPCVAADFVDLVGPHRTNSTRDHDITRPCYSLTGAKVFNLQSANAIYQRPRIACGVKPLEATTPVEGPYCRHLFEPIRKPATVRAFFT